jgi:hypothetical protein
MIGVASWASMHPSSSTKSFSKNCWYKEKWKNWENRKIDKDIGKRKSEIGNREQEIGKEEKVNRKL